MTNSTITIVVPVYNAERFLNQCIESVVNQTVRDWNMLLVDDGSSDRSAEICRSWAKRDRRITSYSRENSGAGAARNFGISQCATRWLTFVDADDTIEPTYLENFHSEALSDNEISIQGYRRIKPDGSALDEFKNFSAAEYHGNEIEKSFSCDNLLDYGQTVGKLYPTQLIKNNRIFFPTDFHLSEDHSFFLSALLKAESIRLNPGTFYNYIEWGTGRNLTARRFPPDELWRRYINLTQLYFEVVSHFDVCNREVLDWYRYFSFTGTLSLYIQSLRVLGVEDKAIHVRNLKSTKENLRKFFRPNSLKGKVARRLILNAPSWLLRRVL